MLPTRMIIFASAVIAVAQPSMAAPISLEDILPGLTFERPVSSDIATHGLASRCGEAGPNLRFGSGGAALGAAFNLNDFFGCAFPGSFR